MAHEKNRAPQACAACRKRKGRCDRLLPNCSFCTSKDIHCSYSHVGAIIVTNQEDMSFPAAFFLDHDAFQWPILDFPPVGLQIPPHAAAELGDVAAIEATAQRYFETVHLWMPIVSRQRFYDEVLKWPTIARADVALLCLSMKLITWIPSTDSPDEHNPIYLSTRLLLHEITVSRSLTVVALQATVILSLYEIGHAIYPAAHTSVSLCAQHGLMLGLGWESLRQKTKLPWIEMEERRRIWWAIVILDRYCSLGWSGGGLSTQGPRGDELLPCDDVSWDEGIVSTNIAMTTSTPSNISMSRFALLAQAAFLLDRVLIHVGDDVMSQEHRDEEALYLNNALQALVTFTMQETTLRRQGPCGRTSLCYSATALLHTRGLSPDQNNPSRLLLARKAMDKMANEYVIKSREIINGECVPKDAASPLNMHWGYWSAVHFTRSCQQDPKPETTEALEIVKAALRVTNNRWKAAGVYLNVLNARNKV